jgi:hypothetical protein
MGRSNFCNISLVAGWGGGCEVITDISHAILGYIFSTFYQYTWLESSNDMCIKVEQHKQALFKIFQPTSKPLYCS